MYIAKCFTEIAGRKYTPGEIIDTPISEAKAERLLRLDAIAPAMKMVPCSAPDPDDAVADEEKQQTGGLDNDATGDSIETEDSEEAETEEFEEETLEIDVADGIVPAAPAEDTPAEEPVAKKTSRGRKKA